MNNHLKALKFEFIITVMILITLYFLSFEKTALIIFGVIWCINTFPALILHFAYYQEDKDKTVEIDGEQITIFLNGVKKFGFLKNDITEIVLYKSGNIEPKGVQFLAMESYHYATIATTQGYTVIITCLLFSDVESEIKKMNGGLFIRQRRIFAGLNFSF